MYEFLDPRFKGRNLAPLNIVSYDTYELGARDAIAITFKDLDTDQIYVETIEKPKYEVYILKKEYWDEATFMAPWESMDKLDRKLISYHWRDRELAQILNCDPNYVKTSPLIFGYDIKIEHYYWIQFLLNYGTDAPKTINMGLFDIESDIIQCDGFAAPGEAPTSAITFVDASKKTVYTLVLGKDNLPILALSNPHYIETEKIKANFYEQVDAVRNNLDGLVAECHEMFDEYYGSDLTYNIMLFDDEIKLHQVFWEIIRRSNIDYLGAWNAPYDIRNLIERPLALGYEPESIITDPAFKYRTCFFEEDDNIEVHKRNHRSAISIKPTMICMMWMYAGVRAAKGKPDSLKLNAVAKKELKDEKLNYEEEGDIRTFMYKNFRKFILYNIKDVLLLFGLHRVTRDIDNVYDRCYTNGMLIPEAFVSTTMLTTSMTKYFLQEGFVIGTNANRILPPFDWVNYIAADKKTLNSLNQLAEEAESFDPDAYYEMAEEEFLNEGSFEEGSDNT